MPSLKLSLSFATMAAAALLIFGYGNSQFAQGSPVFDKVTVDHSGPTDPGAKQPGTSMATESLTC